MLFMTTIVGDKTIKENQKIINTKFRVKVTSEGGKRGWHLRRAHKVHKTIMFFFLNLLMSTFSRERETCVPRVSVTSSWLSPKTLCWEEGDTILKPPELLSLSFTLIELLQKGVWIPSGFCRGKKSHLLCEAIGIWGFFVPVGYSSYMDIFYKNSFVFTQYLIKSIKKAQEKPRW